MVPFNIILFRDFLLLLSILGETLEWTTAMFHAHIVYMLPNFHCCLNPLLHIFGAQRFRRHLTVPCNTSSQGGDEGQNLTSMAVIPPHDASVWSFIFVYILLRWDHFNLPYLNHHNLWFDVITHKSQSWLFAEARLP